MPFWESTILGNPAGRWVTAAGLTAALTIGLLILRQLAVRLLQPAAERSRNRLEDAALALLRRTSGGFLLVLGLYAGAALLALPPRAERLANAAVVIALLLQMGAWGTALIGRLSAWYVEKHVGLDPVGATTAAAFGFFARLLTWTVILLLALDNLGIDITTLIAGLGVGGIAVALAVQNILGDLFASFSIVFDKPFVIGDFIVVDDVLGTVEHIGLKTTRVRSLSGEQVVLANGNLLQQRIRNYKRMFERRAAFTIGVTYETSAEHLALIPTMLREVVQAAPQARFDRAHFKAYGDFALLFEVVYYVTSPDYNVYMDTQQWINLEIFRRFAALGVEFAYPTQTLHVRLPAAQPAG